MSSYKITSNDEILEALHPVPNFQNRDDIKPWMHDRLDPRGISLVIERSDASKVVFKCKNLHRKTSTPRSSTTKLVNGKAITKRIRTSPEDSCPFRLRVSYSVKHKTWAVNVIKPEHNMILCSNFGDGCGSTSSTPNSTMSTKRSWSSTYTPASTTSPIMSVNNSPASTFTPASEHMDFDFDMRNKRTRLSYESPLSHEVDPLDKLSLPEDLSDLNHLVGNNNELQITQPMNFDQSLDYSEFQFNTHEDDLLATHMSATDKMFEMNLDTQMHNAVNEDLYSKLNGLSPLNSKQDLSLNIAGQTIVEEEEDPLMHFLSSTNSRYTIEELESLDKAMGVDANDQFMMSMFQKF